MRKHISTPDHSQTYIFAGETGTGKTTMAYIIGKLLNCTKPSKDGPCNECDPCKSVDMLIEDSNMAYKTGIEDTRELISRITVKPLIDLKRVVILDEAHAITKAAQKAWLKVIEDPRPWLYVFFCTTEPDKFIPDLRNRCRQIKFRPLAKTESVDLVFELSKLENFSINLAQAEDIIRKVGGRPRELVEAAQVFSEGGTVTESAEEKERNLVKELITEVLDGNKTRDAWLKIWNTLLQILEVNGEDPDGVRRIALWWLWFYAENKNGYTNKYKLTRLMDVMAELSQPLEGNDSKYKLVTMLFNAWKSNDGS